MKDFREFLNEADNLSISKYGHEEIEIIMKIFCERIGIPEKGYDLPYSKYTEDHQILTVDYWVLGDQIYPNREAAYKKLEEITKNYNVGMWADSFEKILRVDTSISLEKFKPELKQKGEISLKTILRYFERVDIDIDKELEKYRGKITSKKTGIA